MWLGIYTETRRGVWFDGADFFKCTRFGLLCRYSCPSPLSVRKKELVACTAALDKGHANSSDPAYIEAVARYYLTNYCQGLCLACWIMVRLFLWCSPKMNMALMEKMILSEQFENWWKTEGWLPTLYFRWWPMEGYSSQNLDRRWSLCDETSVLKLHYNFHRCRNSLMSMARSGPLMCHGILGWLV